MRLSTLIFAVLVVSFSAGTKAHAQSVYDDDKFVDIRDLAAMKSQPGGLSGTANQIIRLLEEKPQAFVGLINPLTGAIDSSTPTVVRFPSDGAKGPSGDISVSPEGKETYTITDSNIETRKNSILSAEIEDVLEEVPDKVFLLKVILFTHDSSNLSAAPSNGYYFRRLTVRVDWNIPKDQLESRVQVISFDGDIYLNQTKFNVLGDLLERKVILEEPTFKIYKVFPIAVGSFDIQTAEDMSPVSVSLLTEEFPQGKIKKMTPEDVQSSYPNSRTRVYPSYFSGRPFISLFTSDGDYRAIGMHYKITDKLIRGFVSHGCIRVRDKDLYQIDAILNEGPHEELSAHFVNSLQGYEHLTHPYAKSDSSFNAVVYSSLHNDQAVFPRAARKQTPKSNWSKELQARRIRKVACPGADSEFRVNYLGSATVNDPELGSYSVMRYHTVADGDCLTMVSRMDRPVSEVIDYMKGISLVPPQTNLTMAEHEPMQVGQQLGMNSPVGNPTTDWSSEGGEIYKQKKKGLFNWFLGGGGGVQQPNKPAISNNDPRLVEANKNIQNLQTALKACGVTKNNNGTDCTKWRSYLQGWLAHRQQILNGL